MVDCPLCLVDQWTEWLIVLGAWWTEWLIVLCAWLTGGRNG